MDIYELVAPEFTFIPNYNKVIQVIVCPCLFDKPVTMFRRGGSPTRQEFTLTHKMQTKGIDFTSTHNMFLDY